MDISDISRIPQKSPLVSESLNDGQLIPSIHNNTMSFDKAG